MVRRILSSALLLLSCLTYGQEHGSLNSAGILEGIKKLNVTASVLYVAAHPDDENTRLLAYLANEKKFRTAYLSLTRGDGGQNLIGKEQGEALGLIRTQELLAARRKDGAEQYFTRANDFGFSKNPEETFQFWNKDSILADVVLCIRKFKPDVIICRFPTTGEGGHGHHTASAILALAAFDAAADPLKFPEQLKHYSTWQARRIFWNTYNFGSNNTTSADQLQLDVGIYNPLLGKSYGELAAESRSMHKSQGFGSARQRGPVKEYFKFLKGDSVKQDLFENIQTGWSRFKKGEMITSMIDYCIKNFDPSLPQKSLPQLLNIYTALQKMEMGNDPGQTWKTHQLKVCEKLILACAGVWAEATAADHSGVQGEKTVLTAQIISRNGSPVKLRSLQFAGDGDTVVNTELKNNELLAFKHSTQIRSDVTSNPYWLDKKHGQGRYQVNDLMLRGKAENDAALSVKFILDIGGLEMTVHRPVVYKSVDPVKGEVYRPFEVLPPVNVGFSERSYIFNGAETKTLVIKITANAAGIEGVLRVKAGKGWKTEIQDAQIKTTARGEEKLVIVKVTPGENSSQLEAAVEINGKIYNQDIQRISYDHIPYQLILKDAMVPAIRTEVKTEGEQIAYIPGAGDDVAACLEQIGYKVTLLSDEMIATSDLSKYSAIVTGVRAYNTNERLQLHHAKLMRYVKNGGNLVVQYNTNSRVGPLQAKTGPYPFTISRERVTDEKANITFNLPQHAALNHPNKITAADLEGWVQERGIYFATETAPQYEQVLTMNDPGEKPHKGSLIITAYGKGNFVYTGLAFFRQLPAAVPGAYRLFANLLSLPQNKTATDEAK